MKLLACCCHCSCCSVTKSCLNLCYPMDCSTPCFPVLPISQGLLRFMRIESVMPSNHLTLCHPILLLPSIFPRTRIFSKELAVYIRWPKYWSFSISPSNEYSVLISFRIDFFDLLAVQGTLKNLLQHHNSKHQFFGTQPSLWSNSHIHTCIHVGMCAQLCLTLCNSVDCSQPGTSVHSIFQARILEWVSISYSKGLVTFL